MFPKVKPLMLAATSATPATDTFQKHLFLKLQLALNIFISYICKRIATKTNKQSNNEYASNIKLADTKLSVDSTNCGLLLGCMEGIKMGKKNRRTHHKS